MRRSQRGERTAVEKPLRGNPKTGFPLRLEIPPSARDSHFPTAPAAAVRLHRKCPDKPTESYILKWLDTGTCSKMSNLSYNVPFLCFGIGLLLPCSISGCGRSVALRR